ncbi:UNVERIFIED_CONTAM: hypothetical protein HDU68_011132 [Siphonaria sp. JEL0065]|nr:hypothetical protein HDU68_011132 [Siphonaria sp. JEL0065]
MDGFPSDVTGTLFANLLLSIPPSVENIVWTRVAVSDAHLAKMSERWPKLQMLEVGIVTPYMWGAVRSAVSGPPNSPQFNVLSLNGVGGDDGTAHLLQILSVHAPRSLKSLTLGRGRYLTATQSSAINLWRSVLLFIICKPHVERVSVVDPFETCRRYCLAVWCLSESFIKEAIQKIHKRRGIAGVSSSVNQNLQRVLVDALKTELRMVIQGDGDLDRLVRIKDNVGLRWFLTEPNEAPLNSTSALNNAMALFEILPTVPTALEEVESENEDAMQQVPALTTVIRQSGLLEPVVLSEIGVVILRELVEEFGENDVISALASF